MVLERREWTIDIEQTKCFRWSCTSKRNTFLVEFSNDVFLINNLQVRKENYRTKCIRRYGEAISVVKLTIMMNIKSLRGKLNGFFF